MYSPVPVAIEGKMKFKELEELLHYMIKFPESKRKALGFRLKSSILP